MLIGYARTSTIEQEAGQQAQERDLRAAGCERVFTERVSSVGRREQLEAALGFARTDDAVVVTKPDRLARSTSDLLSIEARLTGAGVGLIVLSMGGERLDTRNPTSRLILTVLGGIAEWERQIMLERQREGISKARQDDAGKPPDQRKYRGRKPTAMAQSANVARLRAEGVTPTEIGKLLGMSRMSVYRALGAVEALRGP